LMAELNYLYKYDEKRHAFRCPVGTDTKYPNRSSTLGHPATILI
jgi:hypothetical protein